MGPKQPRRNDEHDLFRMELVNPIDQQRELARLGELIDWQALSGQWSPQFTSTIGRPALPTRLITALLYPSICTRSVTKKW